MPLIEESIASSETSGMVSHDNTFEFNADEIDSALPRTKDGKTVLLQKRDGSMVHLPKVQGHSLDKRMDGSPMLERTLTKD